MLSCTSAISSFAWLFTLYSSLFDFDTRRFTVRFSELWFSFWEYNLQTYASEKFEKILKNIGKLPPSIIWLDPRQNPKPCYSSCNELRTTKTLFTFHIRNRCVVRNRWNFVNDYIVSECIMPHCDMSRCHAVVTLWPVSLVTYQHS